MAELQGGCLCGRVRYTISGEPAFTGICHCRNCQHFSGSGHVGFLCFPASAVTIEGETRRYDRPGGSGRTATRFFCTTCSSAVFGRTELMSDQINIYAGSLDEPVRFQPALAIFTRSRPPWDEVSRGLTCYETLPS